MSEIKNVKMFPVEQKTQSFLLKRALRSLLKKSLVSSLKLGGFSVWLILAIFDILWIAFVAPFIRKEQRRKKTEVKRKELGDLGKGIVKSKTAKELMQAHKAFYENRKKKV